MALTTAQTGLTPQQWDDKFFMEYVRENRFKRYMGTDENSIIQLKEDLTKKKGDKVTFASVNKLAGAGVTGNGTLEGNEEALDSRSMAVTVAPLRHAVAVTEWDEQKSAIDLRNTAKTALKLWSMEKMRNSIITALGSINGTAYASADATARNAWVVDNADRVLFGKLKSNYSVTHATALANLDNTDDKLTPEAISLMKRIAQTASPAIRPIRLNEDEEWYLLFTNSRSFRDLSVNSTMTQANRDARQRGMDNPLFTGGSLVWDGVIIREIPEIEILANAGAGGAVDVGPSYLCGAQAVGVAWSQRTKTTTQVSDYGFRNGVGLQEMRGIEKLIFGTGSGDTDDLKDHGVVTGFFAAVADS
jgi:N4-gp56 family major capsid protein